MPLSVEKDKVVNYEFKLRSCGYQRFVVPLTTFPWNGGGGGELKSWIRKVPDIRLARP